MTLHHLLTCVYFYSDPDFIPTNLTKKVLQTNWLQNTW